MIQQLQRIINNNNDTNDLQIYRLLLNDGCSILFFFDVTMENINIYLGKNNLFVEFIPNRSVDSELISLKIIKYHGELIHHIPHWA